MDQSACGRHHGCGRVSVNGQSTIECPSPAKPYAPFCICHSKQTYHNNPPFIKHVYQNGSAYNTVERRKLCYRHGLHRYGDQDCGATTLPNLFNRATPINPCAGPRWRGTPVLWEQPTVGQHACSTSWTSAPWDWDSICQDEHLSASLPVMRDSTPTYNYQLTVTGYSFVWATTSVATATTSTAARARPGTGHSRLPKSHSSARS